MTPELVPARSAIMSNTSPADKDESEAEIASTPNIKLAGILQDESVTDGSTLELDSKSPKEPPTRNS